MARGERGESGRLAPARSARPGERSGEGRALREAPTATRAPAEPAGTSRSSGSSWLAAGRGQRLGVSAPAKDPPPPPPTHTHPVASFPRPLALSHAPPAQKKARPPGTGPRTGSSRSAPSSIPGGRGRARGLREGAIQQGWVGMLPGRPAAAVRLPAPSSGRSPRGGWTRAAWASRSGTGVAWHGAAGSWSLRARQGRRTDTSSQEAGGPNVRPGGGVRRRLERAGAVEWTAPPLPASGLLSTSGPWSGDREVGAAAEGDAGRGPSGSRVAARGGGGGPRRTMHLGVKPRLRVSGLLPHHLWLPSPLPPPPPPSRTEPQRPSLQARPGLPPNPSPPTPRPLPSTPGPV